MWQSSDWINVFLDKETDMGVYRDEYIHQLDCISFLF